MVTEGCQ